MLSRLDSHYTGRPKEMIGLTMPPSEYFRRRCLVCSFEPEKGAAGDHDWFNGKNMACTSDYPHWDSSSVSGVVRYLKHFTDINEHG
jgi:hypothetical protein